MAKAHIPSAFESAPAARRIRSCFPAITWFMSSSVHQRTCWASLRIGLTRLSRINSSFNLRVSMTSSSPRNLLRRRSRSSTKCCRSACNASWKALSCSFIFRSCRFRARSDSAFCSANWSCSCTRAATAARSWASMPAKTSLKPGPASSPGVPAGVPSRSARSGSDRTQAPGEMGEVGEDGKPCGKGRCDKESGTASASMSTGVCVSISTLRSSGSGRAIAG
mmetsp:Transcript_66238/g.134558  ORF Transcript_66238/g.134558 Transcript_66238/m.134558 type:complete len:222 (+) Transcript_66238:880-1545(+)